MLNSSKMLLRAPALLQSNRLAAGFSTSRLVAMAKKGGKKDGGEKGLCIMIAFTNLSLFCRQQHIAGCAHCQPCGCWDQCALIAEGSRKSSRQPGQWQEFNHAGNACTCFFDQGWPAEALCYKGNTPHARLAIMIVKQHITPLLLPWHVQCNPILAVITRFAAPHLDVADFIIS